MYKFPVIMLAMLSIGTTTLSITPVLDEQEIEEFNKEYNRDRKTTIHSACKSGCLEMVRNFMANSTDINQVDNSCENQCFGCSPLYIATFWEKTDVVRYLTENRAEVNSVNLKKEMPLHIAAFRCNLEIMRLLIANNAKINEPDANGYSPLHKLIMSPEDQSKVLIAAQYLLYAGAEIESKNIRNLTPLHLALSLRPLENRSAIIPILLERGAQIPYEALHLAVKNNHDISIIMHLLFKGVSTIARDSDGNTPFHCAAAALPSWDRAFFEQRRRIVALLLLFSDTNIRNNQDFLPIEVAQEDEIKRIIVGENNELIERERKNYLNFVLQQKKQRNISTFFQNLRSGLTS